MKTPFISIRTIVEEWLDTSGEKGQIDEFLIYKFANSAMEMLSTDEQLEENIALIQVRNYKVELPDNFKFVVQAAYNIEEEYCSREEVVQWTQKALDGSGCNITIDLDCPRCHKTECSCNSTVLTVDINRIYENAHPELYTSYMNHFYKSGGTTKRGTHSFYHPRFCLMRPKSGSFHNLPYHIGKCLNLDVDCEIEYAIDHPYMIVNFEKGQVLLSYLGVKRDEDGYRLIPNNEYAIDAIIAYIEERMAYTRYRSTESPTAERFWLHAKQEKNSKMRIAKSKLQMPSQDEWKVFLDNYWRKIVPYYFYEQNMRRFDRDDAIPGTHWIV